MNFTNLHTHDTFSELDAIGFPKEYIDYCIELGMDSMAITNHGNMNSLGYGIEHVKKINKERSEPFKLIYGVEGYFKETISEEKDSDKRREHIILLAQNLSGFETLCKLVSNSNKKPNFYFKPRIDLNLLKKYNKGLICSTACISGLMGSVVKDSLKDHLSDKEIDIFKNDVLPKCKVVIIPNRTKERTKKKNSYSLNRNEEIEKLLVQCGFNVIVDTSFEKGYSVVIGTK